MRADNTDITGPESLANGKKLCSVSGSTPAQRIKDKYPGVQLQQYDTYSACVEALRNGAIDAVSTDEVILAGFAAQSPGAFKIIGKPFSVEHYGIGLTPGESRAAHEDQRRDRRDAARRRAGRPPSTSNLGPAGISAPPPPPLDTDTAGCRGGARRHPGQVRRADRQGVLDHDQADRALRDRGADPGHRAGRDAAVAGADAQLAGHHLRQRGAQYSADADHPVLLVRAGTDAGYHAGRPEVADVDRRQQLPAGGAGVVGLHRGVRVRDRARRGQHRAAGPGRGGPLAGAVTSGRTCE